MDPPGVGPSRARQAFAMCTLAALTSPALTARASDPLNSRDRTSASATTTGEETQVNVLPVAGGTTDIGAGVGEFAGITRVRRGVDPYVWNVESAGLVTFKPGEGGGVQVPYGDVYVKLTVPRVFGSASELRVRPSFTTETTLGYYGIGNASSDALPVGASSSYFWYSRTHPAVSVDLRWRIVDHVAAHTAARFTQDWMSVPPGSRLAADLASPASSAHAFLGPTDPHGVALFTYGLQWDDRDSEVAPHSGSFDSALVRLAPGGSGELPYRYGEATIDARVYLPLWKERLTIALRGVGDLLFGQAPVYALARIDEEFAFGGPNEVRGIPAQRYAGKVKVFGTAELRADIVSFHALGKPMKLGLVAFIDGGRVWADVTPHPDLDGTGLNLHYGTGGGVRIQSGQAFVLRGDLAWSPDARPVGGYFAVGQTF